MYPRYMDTATFDGFRLPFFWLKQKLTPQLTQNLCFNIRFHLYIHDLILDEPIGTLTSRVNAYMYPRYRHTNIYGFQLPCIGSNRE